MAAAFASDSASPSASASASDELFGNELDFPVLDDLIDIENELDSNPCIMSVTAGAASNPWEEDYTQFWPLDEPTISAEVISGENDAACHPTSSNCRRARSKRIKRRASELVSSYQTYWGHSHGESEDCDTTSSTYDTWSRCRSLSSSQSSSDDEDTTTTLDGQSSRKKLKQQHKKQKLENHACSHCGSQSTPQWREGPLGPKTLCNACGVRYKSGRLLPEYRPAASPTFHAGLHSNSHRRVLEMHMLNSTTTRAHASSTPTSHQSLVF